MSTSRTLASARCKDRGHLLARLVADATGRIRLEIPRVMVADVRDGRPHMRHDLGGDVVALDEPTGHDTRHAQCACGHDFAINPSELLRAARPVHMVTVEGIRMRAEDAVFAGIPVDGDPTPGRPPTLILTPTRRQ